MEREIDVVFNYHKPIKIIFFKNCFVITMLNVDFKIHSCKGFECLLINPYSPVLYFPIKNQDSRLHYKPLSSTAIRTISSSTCSFFSCAPYSKELIVNVLITRGQPCEREAMASRADSVRIGIFAPASFK